MEIRDNILVPLKAGTTKVTVKYKKKKAVFKVKVKSNGLKVSAKTSFDYNLVSKGWVKGIYTDNHDIDGDDEYEEANPTDAQLKSEFMSCYKDLSSRVTKKYSEGNKYKVGSPYNVVYITVRNNSSHKAIVPEYLNPTNDTHYVTAYTGHSQAERNLCPGVVSQVCTAFQIHFTTSTGKKIVVEPHSTKTIKYIANNKNCLYIPKDTVKWSTCEPGTISTGWIRIVGVGKYGYALSPIYPNRVESSKW